MATMTHKTLRLAAASFSALLLVGVAVSGASAHGRGPGHGRDLAAARAATAQFKDVNKAIAAGYGQPPVPAPLHECISSFDGTGAMGYHFIKGSLLDTTLDPREPEVLVYAPDRTGRLHLVALEYVVFQEPWMDAHGSKMPKLFRQKMMPTGEPNRYDIPAFFALHVWLYKHNPSGMFAPFNPKVTCDPGRGGHRSAATGTGPTLALATFSCQVSRPDATAARRT